MKTANTPLVSDYRLGYDAGWNAWTPIIDEWQRMIIAAPLYTAKSAVTQFEKGYVRGWIDVSRGAPRRFTPVSSNVPVAA